MNVSNSKKRIQLYKISLNTLFITTAIGCAKLSTDLQNQTSLVENQELMYSQKQNATLAQLETAASVSRTNYGIPAKLIFMQAKRNTRSCDTNLVLDLKQELSLLKKLRDVTTAVPNQIAMDESLSVLTSTLEAQRNSLPGLRSVMTKLWYSVVYEGYRGLDGELSEDMIKLLDFSWAQNSSAIFTESPLRIQLNFYKSANYRPVMTDLIRQKLSLLDRYDVILGQLVTQQAQVFQSIATKVDNFANCRIQASYPRLEMNLAALPLNDQDLLIEKYAPQGAFSFGNQLTSALDYRPELPGSLGRGRYATQASFISSDLFSDVLTNRSFNLNGIKSELINKSTSIQAQYQTYKNQNAMNTFPGLTYHPVHFDPMGQDLISSFLGQIISPNAGNSTIWTSIQRLGINYSVNVYKQRLQAACGFSCPVLNHYSISGGAIAMVEMLDGDPLSSATNYEALLEKFKKQVINQNILARVLSEARAQTLHYFATRILVSRKWMDSIWFQYARNSGMVEESWIGASVSYVSIMDINLVLYSMLYSDAFVRHATETQANPLIQTYIERLTSGLVRTNFSSGDEASTFQEIGRRMDLLQKSIEEGNQIFSEGFLVN